MRSGSGRLFGEGERLGADGNRAVGAGMTGGLCLLPQTFTFTVSISVQRPGGDCSPLGGLIGSGGGQKSYGGVVKSLRMAGEVESKSACNSLPLPSAEAPPASCPKCWLDDNAAEGLLYITVALPAPPRIAVGANSREKERGKRQRWQPMRMPKRCAAIRWKPTTTKKP